MIADIIAVAAGDRKALANPLGTADAPTALLLLGGSALFLAGNALFKTTIWHSWSWTRMAAIVVLALLVPVSPCCIRPRRQRLKPSQAMLALLAQGAPAAETRTGRSLT